MRVKLALKALLERHELALGVFQAVEGAGR